jgi:hypothetical protein
MVSLQDDTPTRIFVECPFNLAQFRTIEMDEIKNENELGRRAEVVTTAAHLGLALQLSSPSRERSVAEGKLTNLLSELAVAHKAAQTARATSSVKTKGRGHKGGLRRR